MAYGRGHTDLTWRTPLNCNGGACVKVAASGPEVLIADSKEPDGPVLSYSHAEWQEFVTSVKQGDFDDLIK
jgi:predicted secreted Zn-dependent protease